MGTMTITEFLLARIAERESVARDMQHQARVGRPFFRTDLLAGGTGIRELIDPARVMAECEAKRRIVELHKAYATPQVMIYGTITACETCGSVDDSPVEWPCDTLKALAAVYADHPDYREEWRP